MTPDMTPETAQERPSGAYVPADGEPLPSGLIPAERMALTVARAQLERGENPGVNMTTVLVMALDRLTGHRDWTADHDSSRSTT